MDELLQVVWDVDEETYTKNSQPVINNDQYIFYDPSNGGIKCISNSRSELNLPYIVLNIDEINKIITGFKPIHEYKVIFSPDEKEFVLIHVSEEEDILYSVSDIIYQYPFKVDTSIPLEFDNTNDITIVQDYNDTCWKFYINNKLAKSLGEKKLYFDNIHELYITALNDPNILYKTLELPLKELITNYYFIIPFDEIDYKEIKISVYSRKLFNKYQYIKTKL
jgi:hypothetical protein